VQAAKAAYASSLARRMEALADLEDALQAKRALCSQLKHILAATEVKQDTLLKRITFHLLVASPTPEPKGNASIIKELHITSSGRKVLSDVVAVEPGVQSPLPVAGSETQC